jgi:hypothetical protein
MTDGWTFLAVSEMVDATSEVRQFDRLHLLVEGKHSR